MENSQLVLQSLRPVSMHYSYVTCLSPFYGHGWFVLDLTPNFIFAIGLAIEALLWALHRITFTKDSAKNGDSPQVMMAQDKLIDDSLVNGLISLH